jgi:hypothetical protein
MQRQEPKFYDLYLGFRYLYGVVCNLVTNDLEGAAGHNH